jgi:hypothetical protein
MREFAMTADSMARLAAAGTGGRLIRLAKTGTSWVFQIFDPPDGLTSLGASLILMVTS